MHPSKEFLVEDDDALIVYRLEVVGGPFDGCAGMRWFDDGEHPLPELILLGVCPGDGLCATRNVSGCARRRSKHPYYWLPEERERPTRVTAYELSDSFLLPEEPARAREYPGRAIYVIGGLHLPRGREERELVGAGAPGGGRSLESMPGRVHAGYPGVL